MSTFTSCVLLGISTRQQVGIAALTRSMASRGYEAVPRPQQQGRDRDPREVVPDQWRTSTQVPADGIGHDRIELPPPATTRELNQALLQVAAEPRLVNLGGAPFQEAEPFLKTGKFGRWDRAFGVWPAGIRRSRVDDDQASRGGRLGYPVRVGDRASLEWPTRSTPRNPRASTNAARSSRIRAKEYCAVHSLRPWPR